MYLLAGIIGSLFIHENFTPLPKGTLRKSGNPFRHLSLGIWLVFFLIVMMAIARRFDDPYIPLMVEKIHGPDDTAFLTGVISAVTAVAGILSAMFIGRLCDRFTPERVTIPSILLAVAGMFAQAVAGTLGFFTTARFVNFLAAGGMEPAFFSILSKISAPSRKGAIFGLASSIRMGGILLSSLLSGAVIHFYGVRAIFAVAGVIFFLILPIFLWTMRQIRHAEDVEAIDSGE